VPSDTLSDPLLSSLVGTASNQREIVVACRYKKLWDQDKDAYIRRYEKANKPLSSYELDIKEYLNKEVSPWRVCGVVGVTAARALAVGLSSGLSFTHQVSTV